MLRRNLILLLALALAEAEPPLLLSSLRTPAPAPLPPAPPPPPLPATFLPLCGNGRIDTIEDYKAMSNRSLATFTTYDNGKVTFFATETCDDGNRLDNDGCSADCMHRDLWTSPCQLQIGLRDFEAIAALEGLGMVLSTATGLHLADMTPSPGDVVLHTKQLLTKDFPVTNIFSFQGRHVAYSAPSQMLYTLSNDGSALNAYNNLSGILRPSTDSGFQFPSRGLLVLHDTHTIAVFNMTSGKVQGTCTMASNLDKSMYLGLLDSDGLRMHPIYESALVSVDPLTNGTVICKETIFIKSDALRYQIWRDAFSVVIGTSFVSNQEYNLTVDGPVPSLQPKQPSYIEYYTPMGLWTQAPLFSPRAWVAKDDPIPSPWIGHPLIKQGLDTVMTGLQCASDAPCMMDISSTYDLFLADTVGSNGDSWATILQGLVQEAGIKTAQTLYTNTTAYTDLWRRWTDTITKTTADRMIKGFAVNPATGSIWTIRSSALYEISKAGVQVKLLSGKCMPSGLAACPACYWAPAAGGQCVPCGTKGTMTWASSLQCLGCTTSSRRLLQQAEGSTIQFSVVGSALPTHGNESCMQGATSTPRGDGVYNVKLLPTKDPASCLRKLMPALAGFQVIVKPAIIITITSSSSLADTGGDSTQMSTGAIVGVAIAGVVVLVAMGLIYFEYFSTRSYIPVPTHSFHIPLHGLHIPTRKGSRLTPKA